MNSSGDISRSWIPGLELVKQMMERAEAGVTTLVYAAKDEQHNNAVALKEYLTARMET